MLTRSAKAFVGKTVDETLWPLTSVLSSNGATLTNAQHAARMQDEMERWRAENAQAEAALLDHYHAALLVGLVEFGAAPTSEAAKKVLPRSTLQAQYEAAVLDMCRVIFAYHWDRIKASPQVLAKNARSLGKNSYNKSIPVARWVVSTCHALLEQRSSRLCKSDDQGKMRLISVTVQLDRIFALGNFRSLLGYS